MEIIKMVVKNLFKLVLALIVVIALVFGCVKIYNVVFVDKNPLDNEEQTEEPSDETVAVKTVKGYLAMSTDTEGEDTAKVKTISKTGTILAGQEVSISPEISGNIKELLVQEGSLVKKGDVIAKLENSTQLQNAVISYNSTIQLLGNAEKLLNITAQSGAVSISTFDEQFASARLNVQKAAIQLESAKAIRYNQFEVEDINSATTDLQKQLTDKQAEAAKELASNAGAETAAAAEDTMQTTYNSASEGVSNESDYYTEYLKNSIENNQNVSKVKTRELSELQGAVQDDQNYLNIEAAQIQLNLLAKQLQSTELQNQASIINARNQIIQLKQQVETAKVSLSLGEIRSPINGAVTNVTITKGSKVTPGQQILTVTNFDEINIKLFLSPVELVELIGVPKSKLKVNVEVLGVTVEASINYFGIVANPQTRTIPVEISPKFKNQSEKSKFIPNTFAKAKFQIPVASTTPTEPVEDNNFRLPITALVKDENKFKVAVVENGVVAYKNVVLAAKIKNGKTAIKTGITDGTEIILSPNNNLVAGTKVTIQ